MDKLTAARVLIDVALTESFTATAERLGMSRPMVTRHVEALEDWLGVRLLQRSTRKVSLTSAGEQSLPILERWVKQADTLSQQWQSQEKLQGKIKVAASISFGFTQLIPAINAFMQKHEGIEVDIELQDTAIDLIKERIDLAIRIALDPSPALIGRPIAVCESVLVAAPSYLKKKPAITHPNDLAGHSCLIYKRFDQAVWQLYKHDQRVAVEVSGRLVANEATALLSAAIQGMGISMQPVYLAHSAIRSGQLEVVLPQWQPRSMDIYALYSSRRHQPLIVRTLLDHLVDYYQQHPWAGIALS